MSEMLPQSQPHSPAPTPSGQELKLIRRRNWLVGIGIIFLVLVIGGVLTAPRFIRGGHRHHDLTETMSNARQIGLALFEFEANYGSFPDSSTIPLLEKEFPNSTIPLGTHSSNDFFRQLLVCGIVSSEDIFYARLTKSIKKPDNVFMGSRALEKGECGFAYIAGLSSADNPSTPIVLWPVIPGKRLFDYKLARKFQNGKAAILRIDNSVMTLPIDKSGHVYLHSKDLFDPTNPIWNGKPPDIKWPEK